MTRHLMTYGKTLAGGSIAFVLGAACFTTDYNINPERFCQKRPNDVNCVRSAPVLAPCDPSTAPDAATGVFVSLKGDDANDGSRERPYATIEKAAAAGKPNVYVMQGIYAVEKTIELAAAVVIDGGWTTEWKRRCEAPQDTTLQGKTAAVSPVIRFARGGALTYLAVKTVDQAPGSLNDQPATSLVALHVVSADPINASNVLIEAGKASDAATAAAPGAVSGTIACNSLTDCLPQSRQAGTKGEAGMPGNTSTGVITLQGYVPSTGQDGTSGQPGSNGGTGLSGTIDPNCVKCPGTTQDTCSGTVTITDTMSANGKCGCGGKGGTGGRGGRGGGASIALLITDPGAVIYLSNTQLRTSQGGKGTAGTSGSQGAEGAPGEPGEAQCSVRQGGQPASCQWSAPTNKCVLSPSKQLGSESGGPGGPGGPGAGGPSYAIAAVKGASLQLDPSVTLTPGQGGLSGDGVTRAESAPQKSF